MASKPSLITHVIAHGLATEVTPPGTLRIFLLKMSSTHESTVDTVDTTVIKVDLKTAPSGPMKGVKELASGKDLSLRSWDITAESDLSNQVMHSREYETAGVVLKGSAKLLLEGKPEVTLKEGDSYCVPAGARHKYEVVSLPFQAIEGCSPIEFLHNRNAPVPSEGEGGRTAGGGHLGGGAGH